MQHGVSNIYGSPTRRILHRSGGPESPDLICQGSSGSTCQTFCTTRMNYDSLCGANVPLGYDSNCSPYYLKCFDASASSPINQLRIQFPSQESTQLFDPAIPQMIPVTNVSACLRVQIFIHLNLEWKCRLIIFFNKFYFRFIQIVF